MVLLLSLNCASSQERGAEVQKAENVQNGAEIFVQGGETKFEDPVAILKQSELPPEMRKMAASQLIQEDQAESANILFAVCQTDPSLFSEGVISYFGEKKYSQAIPLIQKTLAGAESQDLVYSCLFALTRMETNDTDEYVLNACAVKANTKPAYYRYQCLLSIHDTENKQLKKKAIPIFNKVMEAPKTKEDPKLQKLVADFLGANGARSSVASATPPNPVPQAPPVAAPKPKLPKTPPIISSSPSLSSGTSKQGTQTAFRSKNVRSALARGLGKEKASAFLETVDRNLKKYAAQRNDTTDFLIRSYQRYYRKNKLGPKEAKTLMQKGLDYSGSLKAIIKNIKREYKQAPLRSYSFSKIFRVPRSQAKLLLSL